MNRHRVPHLLLCCALVALPVSCAQKVAPGKTKAYAAAPSTANTANVVANAAPSAVASPAVSALNCAASHVPPLDPASVAKLVNRWKLAQRTADFSSYSALYAEHFSGLSAGAAGVSRLDRKAWLQAHEPSLTLDPMLATTRVRVAIGAGGAQVTFEQRNAPAHEPLPELFVIPTTEGLKIVREAPRRPAPHELSEHPGVWLANERFAILSTKPEASWSEGAPSFSGDSSASSAVALARLPKALRAWLGRPVRVLGDNGAVCETRLQRFAIHAQISPDLATAEVWDGCSDDHAQTPAQMAEDIWQLSALEGRTLVAELSVPCKGALLAVDPDLPTPAIAAAQPASAELGVAALAAFRALPAYAQLQARFKSTQPDASGAWDDTEARRSVWSLDLAEHHPLVLVSVEAGTGCSHFSGSLSALWEVSAGGSGTPLTLLAVPSPVDDRQLTPRAVLDLGDGAGVLMSPNGVYRAQSLLTGVNHIYQRVWLTSVPFFAGPC